jgi:hypothetical protein
VEGRAKALGREDCLVVNGVVGRAEEHRARVGVRDARSESDETDAGRGDTGTASDEAPPGQASAPCARDPVGVVAVVWHQFLPGVSDAGRRDLGGRAW